MANRSSRPPSLPGVDNLTLFSLAAGDGLPVNWVTERVRETGFAPERFREPGFWVARMHRDDLPVLQRGLATLLERGTASLEYRFQHADDTWRWYCAQVALQRDAAGEASEILGCWVDISARIESEQRQRESEARYRNIVEHVSEGVLQVDERGVVTFANGRVARMLGYAPDELVGKPITTVVDPSRWRAYVEGPEARDVDVAEAIEATCLRRDGHPVSAHVVIWALGAPDPRAGGALVLITDLSERRDQAQRQLELEGQLRQAQKMDALGRLTAGIAHDFNNLVGVTLLSAGWGLQQVDAKDPMHEVLSDIRKAALRGSALTKQLLAFSRQQVLEPSVVDVGALVLDMQSMLARVIGHEIELEVELRGEDRSTLADAGQLEQVLMNLVVNARDAMVEGGRVQIEVARRDLDDLYLSCAPNVAKGRYVVISVTDTGSGMDQATLSHLFEPFYTTKEKGRGTGLGLSTSYGIVRQSGGFICVHSELGRGTVFRVYLPSQRPALEQESEKALAPRGTETILIVEDDLGVRAAEKRALRDRGYELLGASTLAEALARCRGFAGQIALLICELRVGGEDGHVIAEALRAERPGLRVLFTSGLALPDARSDAQLLQKPFTADELARRVRAVLDPSPEPDVPRTPSERTRDGAA